MSPVGPPDKLAASFLGGTFYTPPQPLKHPSLRVEFLCFKSETKLANFSHFYRFWPILAIFCHILPKKRRKFDKIEAGEFTFNPLEVGFCKRRGASVATWKWNHLCFFATFPCFIVMRPIVVLLSFFYRHFGLLCVMYVHDRRYLWLPWEPGWPYTAQVVKSENIRETPSSVWHPCALAHCRATQVMNGQEEGETRLALQGGDASDVLKMRLPCLFQDLWHHLTQLSACRPSSAALGQHDDLDEPSYQSPPAASVSHLQYVAAGAPVHFLADCSRARALERCWTHTHPGVLLLLVSNGFARFSGALCSFCGLFA